METVVKKVWNPDTGQEYEIELPASEVVEQAILELNFPPEGFMNREVADELANVFQLSDNEKRARANVKGITYIFRDQIVLPTFRRLLREKRLSNHWDQRNSMCLLIFYLH